MALGRFMVVTLVVGLFGFWSLCGVATAAPAFMTASGPDGLVLLNTKTGNATICAAAVRESEIAGRFLPYKTCTVIGKIPLGGTITISFSSKVVWFTNVDTGQITECSVLFDGSLGQDGFYTGNCVIQEVK